MRSATDDVTEKEVSGNLDWDGEARASQQLDIRFSGEVRLLQVRITVNNYAGKGVWSPESAA